MENAFTDAFVQHPSFDFLADVCLVFVLQVLHRRQSLLDDVVDTQRIFARIRRRLLLLADVIKT